MLERTSIEGLHHQLCGSHLRVWKRDGTDGITWDQLQAVKNEVVGPDACCIEVYPPAHEVVNDINCRHLWVVDEAAVPSLKHRDRY